MNRKHRLRRGNIVLPSRISHIRNECGLAKCPATDVYWICVFSKEHGWRAARVADERDFRYLTKTASGDTKP